MGDKGKPMKKKKEHETAHEKIMAAKQSTLGAVSPVAKKKDAK